MYVRVGVGLFQHLLPTEDCVPVQLSQPVTASSSHCLLNVLEKLGVFGFFAVHWCCLVAVLDVSVSAESFLE